MSVITQAIADRQSQIDRLQAEITALSDVEKMLGGAAPQAKPARRRSSSRKAAAAPAAVKTASEAKPRKRKRREMSAEEKKAVSERMKAYWASRRAGK